MTKRDDGREDAPVDLSPLDPAGDPGHLEVNLQRIRRASTPELLRRQQALGVWGELARWRRRILMASGALVAASIVTISVVRPQTASAKDTTHVLGIPTDWSEWIQSDERPGPGDLLKVGRSD